MTIEPDRAGLSALIARLETLAKAATKGPWRAEGRGNNLTVVFIGEPGPERERNAVCFIADGSARDRENNSTFIAAANPEMILALCDALKARLA